MNKINEDTFQLHITTDKYFKVDKILLDRQMTDKEMSKIFDYLNEYSFKLLSDWGLLKK